MKIKMYDNNEISMIQNDYQKNSNICSRNRPSVFVF